MIPVRLELSDFLSYSDPVCIDFTGFDVACLTGDNGAGKSALLDAITWSIWGCARGCEGGINQERLIRDGADETRVEFTFELQGQSYRVARRRSRSGKAELRFLVADADDWRNLAAESLRETEARITSLLRMDYRTFVASAFFVQGRSDDFLARMKPEDRKEVFSRLLDLGVYEELADVARLRAREAEVRRAQQAARVHELAGAPDDLAAIETAMHEATQVVASAEKTVATSTATARAARDDVSALEKSEALLEAERTELSSAERSLAELEASMQRRLATLEQIDELVAREDEVREAVAEAARLRGADEEFRSAQDRAAELTRTKTELVERIDAERRAIVTRTKERTTRVTALERELASLDKLEAKLVDAEQRLADVGDPNKGIDDVRAQLVSLQTSAARLDEQLLTVGRTEGEIKEKLGLLRGGGGECPVCGTALDAAHRAQAKRALDAEFRGCKERREALKAELATVRKETDRFTEDSKRLQRTVAEHERLVATRTDLSARLSRTPDVRTELDELRSAAANDAALAEGEEFAAEFRRELREIEGVLGGVYDPAEHANVRKRLDMLLPYEAMHGRLEEARDRRASLVEELESGRQGVESAKTACVERRDRIATLERLVAPLEGARRALLSKEQDVEDAQGRAHTAAVETAKLAERLDAAKAAVEALGTARDAEVSSALEHRRYARLAEAFGRAGIPQLIIENERPQLEDEANRVLGALSDDEMSVQFRFQRETKAGKARETLEVLVRPHDGEPREFAMFSGGEAFRIAFAVRFALSKLLTRRAGARLETLVIDEGFGSQDPQGRERLIEAINLARNEFAKILVVTHLEELKDQFGAQIRVSKDHRGSVLELSVR